MAVAFLTDEQAARYGSFYGVPARVELERFFFLDDVDREKVQAKRRAPNRLGFVICSLRVSVHHVQHVRVEAPSSCSGWDYLPSSTTDEREVPCGCSAC
ncbi:DUF4158 domain-containing protein [Kitasatospora hibisci]|uniref:DUF4158 domain-containing protein n=1 Tax=Kitasatospora hibisci TaxID=3369522 RepID=UPI003753EF1C